MSLLSVESGALLLIAVVATRFAGRRSLPCVLLGASAAFYLLSSPGGAAWLGAATALTYTAGALLARVGPRGGRVLVTSAALLILGALVYVKLPESPVLAPLGISYFSFRLLSYLFDVYWGKCPPTTSLTSFAAYVAFFPEMTSGPIDRWPNFRLGMSSFEPPDYERMSSAMRLVLFGLFKKVVVANRLGGLVDPVFDRPGSFGPGFLVAAAYAFPIQLYADFSGMTDIARGASRLLGIEAPRNFDRPFLAASVQEFWSRWHMTLTSWLRDYLFKPVTVMLRREGQAGLAVAIAVNMIAVGLWHGLKWTFLAFGLLNAFYLVLPMLSRRGVTRREVGPQRLRRLIGVVSTLHLMMLAFVFFRADDLISAARVLAGFADLPVNVSHAFDAQRPVGATPWGIAAPLAIMALVEYAVARGWWNVLRRPGLGTVGRWTAYYVMIVAIIFMGNWGRQDSIYARF